MATTDTAWIAFRRRGTTALVLYVLLVPLGMAAWVTASYEWADDTVSYWVGSETHKPLPHLRTVPKERVSLLQYAYHAVGAEYAAPRFWTTLAAVLAGAMALLSCALPSNRHAIGWGTTTAWMLTGVGLIVLGLDERFQLHEWFAKLVTRPSGIVESVSWLRSDVAVAVYPLGGAVIAVFLYRSLRGDSFARGCLIAALLTGAAAVAVDVLRVEWWREFPMRIYVDFFEEFTEFATVALMAIVAFRRGVLVLLSAGAPASPTNG